MNCENFRHPVRNMPVSAPVCNRIKSHDQTPTGLRWKIPARRRTNAPQLTVAEFPASSPPKPTGMPTIIGAIAPIIGKLHRRGFVHESKNRTLSLSVPLGDGCDVPANMAEPDGLV
jgi:hypothetical protein